MSDEEKKAIESFKEENNNDLSRFDDFNSYTQFKVKRDKLIIDLIEKQSKEIESLKEDNKKKSIVKIEELENYYRELYKQDNSPNEFLIGQDCLSKLSILQEVKQSLLEKE